MKLPEPEKLPSGKWRVRVMIDGKSHSKTCRTRKECKDWLIQMKAGIDVPEKSDETVGELVDTYIEERGQILSPSTSRGYKMIRKNHFQNIMDKKVQDVDWQKAVNAEAKDNSGKTVRNAFVLVKAAVESGGYDVPRVTMPRVEQKEKQFLQPDEVLKLIDVVKGKKIEMEVLLAIHGLRRSEAFALRKKDIYDGYIHIRRTWVRGTDGMVERNDTKTSASKRDVPVLIPRLQELVDKIEDPDERLVKSSFAGSWISIQCLCEANGLPVISLHNLRHSFASLCYYLRIPELEAARLGGWSDITVMRKVYTHLADKEKAASKSKLEEFFRGKNVANTKEKPSSGA